MKGKIMKLRTIFYGLTSGLLLGLSSCSLNYEPLDTYSDVTEGVTSDGTKIVFKDKAAVESHLTTLYNQMRDRQEHWYVDLLLISDSHSDNAYAGTTGAEVVPFENNSIEGSNSVLERDWNRYLEDVARANKLICNIDLVTDNSLTTAERAQYKAEAKIFRAMVMFDMVRLWGDFPVITTVADDITSENIDEVYPQYFPKQNTELQNVTIRGRGVICGEHLTSLGDEGRIVCINKKSNNIKIEGINVMHPKVWTIAMYQSNNIHIDNVHTISHGMSSDGCDITGCHDVLVENSFFRGHDDILAVKARDFINEMPVPQTCENVTFRNCVVWCDSSNPMTIGYETNQDIRNIRYERIDVLNISRPNVWQLEAVMAIEPHNEGVVDGVVYKDIRVDVKVPQNSLFRFVVDEGTGTIRNVRIEDVYINYGGTLGGIIYGTTQAEVSGVDFINVRNSEGLSLAEDKVTTNVYTSNINVSPNLKNGTWVGEVWDFSTEFSGFSSEQGRFDWYYKYLDGSEMKELLWNSSRNFWDVDTYCYIGWQRTDTNPVRNFPQMAAAMHPDVNKQPILIWKAPASGKILVRGKVRRPGTCGDGVDVSVRKNYQIPFWSMTIESSNQNFVDMGTNTVSVNKGDEVQFMVSMRGDNGCDNTEWLPVIEYLSLE